MQALSVLHPDRSRLGEIGRYHGVELSEQAVRMARAACPGCLFTTADILMSLPPDTTDDKAVISLESLEHVLGDHADLARIHQGARVQATVSNFPYESHVRHFKSAEEVRQRYAPLFQLLRVDAWAADGAGRDFS